MLTLLCMKCNEEEKKKLQANKIVQVAYCWPVSGKDVDNDVTCFTDHVEIKINNVKMPVNVVWCDMIIIKVVQVKERERGMR